MKAGEGNPFVLGYNFNEDKIFVNNRITCKYASKSLINIVYDQSRNSSCNLIIKVACKMLQVVICPNIFFSGRINYDNKWNKKRFL